MWISSISLHHCCSLKMAKCHIDKIVAKPFTTQSNLIIFEWNKKRF